MNIPPFDEYKLLPVEERKQIRQYQKKMGLPVYEARKGVPSILKGRPNLGTRGPKGPMPHRWRVGPDDLRHDMFRAWHCHRAQAIFRGEDYALTFEDFEQAWDGLWFHRGRHKDALVMTRRDDELPWCRGNIEIIPRKERLKRTGLITRWRNS
jgi:hypothetical protein